MDYEKAYKYALERAKKLYEQGTITESLSYVFPELAESEDEIIRKKIIEYLKDEMAAFPSESRDYQRWIAWLEKQGKKEQDVRYKYLEKLLEADTIYQMAMNDAMVKEAKTKAIEAISNMDIFELLELEKQGEQKSILDELEMTLSVSEEGYLRENIEKLIKEFKNEEQQ